MRQSQLELQNDILDEIKRSEDQSVAQRRVRLQRVAHSVSQLASLFTPRGDENIETLATGGEAKDGVLKPFLERIESMEEADFDARSNQLILAEAVDPEALQVQLEKAVTNFKTYFKQALIEIRDLRDELGEADWTNRELKIAVKEKSHQNKELIDKIERFE